MEAVQGVINEAIKEMMKPYTKNKQPTKDEDHYPELNNKELFLNPTFNPELNLNNHINNDTLNKGSTIVQQSDKDQIINDAKSIKDNDPDANIKKIKKMLIDLLAAHPGALGAYLNYVNIELVTESNNTNNL